MHLLDTVLDAHVDEERVITCSQPCGRGAGSVGAKFFPVVDEVCDLAEGLVCDDAPGQHDGDLD